MASFIFNNLLQSLYRKALHKAHRTSWGIKAHSRCNLAFRFSRESWEVRQALLSRMDRTEKSKGFRSGLLEGQSSMLMNAGMWAWIHRWVILEPMWGGRVLLEDSRCSFEVLSSPWQQFIFQNVRDVPLAVQFHSWGHENSSICTVHPKNITDFKPSLKKTTIEKVKDDDILNCSVKRDFF